MLPQAQVIREWAQNVAVSESAVAFGGKNKFCYLPFVQF